MPRPPYPPKPDHMEYLEAALPALWSAIVRHLDMFEDDQPEAVVLSPQEMFNLRFVTLLSMGNVEGEDITLGTLRFGEIVTGDKETTTYPAIVWTPDTRPGGSHLLIRPPEVV